MADTFANSYDGSQSNMIKYPLYLQAVGGDAAIVYAAQDYRELVTALWPNGGQIRAGDFLMTQRAAGANFSVDIATGFGVIRDVDSPTTSALVRTTGVVNLATPTAPGSGATRIHNVVAEVLDKQASGTLYGWRFHLLEDTGSGTPATPAGSFQLGTISISVGQGSVLTANIFRNYNTQGFVKYTAAINATGQNQALATNATTAVQFINPRTFSNDVTASGTNNTIFTLNKAGPWSFDCGCRITAGTTGQHFVQLVRNDTGEIISAWYETNLTLGSIYDITISGSDFFASTGASVSLNVTTGSGVSGSSINSGSVNTGLRTFLAATYTGA